MDDKCTCTNPCYQGRSHPRENHRKAGRIGNREGKARGGRIGGRISGRIIASKPGHMAAIGRIGGRNGNREAKVRGARNGGRKIVKSGQAYINQKGTPIAIDENLVAGSFDEATTYLALQEAGISYAIPEPIVLPDGSFYFPDLILFEPVGDIPVGVPIELKPVSNKSPDGIFWRTERQREKTMAAGVAVFPYSALWEE